MDPPRSEPLDPFTRAVTGPVLRSLTALNTFVYRLTDGTVAGEIPNGGRLLLLTTQGRRSSRSITVPLLYEPLDPAGAVLAVVASMGGAPTDPGWLHNVRANPVVEVQVGGRIVPARARVADPAERAAVWPRLVQRYRYFADYQRRAGGREIPVVVLELDGDRAVDAARRFRGAQRSRDSM